MILSATLQPLQWRGKPLQGCIREIYACGDEYLIRNGERIAETAGGAFKQIKTKVGIVERFYISVFRKWQNGDNIN